MFRVDSSADRYRMVLVGHVGHVLRQLLWASLQVLKETQLVSDRLPTS